MIRKDDKGLYHCTNNESHIWMADIGICPYCNLTPIGRIHGMEQAGKIEKLERKLEQKSDYSGEKGERSN
jgi:DNA-binding helix-hairpin-helix protein with protein kinase domain